MTTLINEAYEAWIYQFAVGVEQADAEIIAALKETSCGLVISINLDDPYEALLFLSRLLCAFYLLGFTGDGEVFKPEKNLREIAKESSVDNWPWVLSFSVLAVSSLLRLTGERDDIFAPFSVFAHSWLKQGVAARNSQVEESVPEVFRTFLKELGSNE